MDEMKTLFDRREEVGRLIDNILNDRDITKRRLCEDAGISRPTLDRIIMGKISSMSTFNKHIAKICNALDISTDDLLYRKGRTKAIREKLHMNFSRITDIIGISEKRLAEIENGADASLEELRDIALCLGTSVRALKNEEYFDRTMLGMNSMFPEEDGDLEQEISALWGHVGILPEGRNEYLWFPVSGLTRKKIYNQLSCQRMVIPCMNNRLLMLNMQHIKSVILLDEACDAPAHVNWDPETSNGELAAVVYEAINDYFYGSGEHMSDGFRRYMGEIAEDYHWNEDTVKKEIYETEIYYKDGQMEINNIVFGEFENVSDDIDYIYSMGKDDGYENVYHYIELTGEEHIFNTNLIGLMVMPLISVEDALTQIEC